MARPVKWRRVEFIPNVHYFAPFGADKKALEENILLVEELEALRLKDLEGMEQEECAEKMEVSRQTFQRILNTARAKVADSLINGKAVKIAGGNYTRNICPVRCLDCGKHWNESYENLGNIINGEYSCPACNSNKIACLHNGAGNFCGRNCRRHGRGGQI